MNAHDTIQIIQLAGGDVAFARLLGMAEQPGSQQRINNWKRRGMPSAIVLKHYDILQALKTVARTTGENKLPHGLRHG